MPPPPSPATDCLSQGPYGRVLLGAGPRRRRHRQPGALPRYCPTSPPSKSPTSYVTSPVEEAFTYPSLYRCRPCQGQDRSKSGWYRGLDSAATLPPSSSASDPPPPQCGRGRHPTPNPTPTPTPTGVGDPTGPLQIRHPQVFSLAAIRGATGRAGAGPGKREPGAGRPGSRGTVPRSRP